MSVAASDTELRQLYRILDIRQKLDSGQAYVEVRRTMVRPPRGNFPPGTRSRMINIRLTVNDWLLCKAHHYINADGTDYTEPDPKWIRVDDVEFKEGNAG